MDAAAAAVVAPKPAKKAAVAADGEAKEQRKRDRALHAKALELCKQRKRYARRWAAKVVMAQKASHVNLVPDSVCIRLLHTSSKSRSVASRTRTAAMHVLRTIVDADLHALMARLAEHAADYKPRVLRAHMVARAAHHLALTEVEPVGYCHQRAAFNAHGDISRKFIDSSTAIVLSDRDEARRRYSTPARQ